MRTGSIEASPATCSVCGRARGLVYAGPLYGESVDEVVLCPWCIADGSAAGRLELELTDIGWGVPPGVPEPVLDELAHCTPGFVSWQSDHWLYHCGDACAYLGAVGYDELRRLPDALAALLDGLEEDGFGADESREIVESLSPEESPTAYLFRCLACGTHVAYSDND